MKLSKHDMNVTKMPTLPIKYDENILHIKIYAKIRMNMKVEVIFLMSHFFM